jgi:hypothetical protein
MGTAPCKGACTTSWQTDALAAANPENAAVEGETFGADAVTPTRRLGNYCQICTKEFTITETQEDGGKGRQVLGGFLPEGQGVWQN